MKPFIAVLAGGRSPEHEVSLRSGAAVLAGLAERGFSTLPVLIARDGRWHVGQPGKSDLLALAATSPGRNALEGMLQLKGSGIYLDFPALHGRGGEDGSVQTLCQEAQLPCVGSGPLASALGMSKIRSRHAFLGAGLPMAKAYIPEPEARQTTPASVHLERILQTARLELPLFLKADSSGSSLGVERITHQGAFAPALERVRSLDPEWLVEEEITGIEVSCAILGNCGSKLVPLPPVEIRPLTSRFFDYAAKYDPGATLELCPATSLTPDEIQIVSDAISDLSPDVSLFIGDDEAAAAVDFLRANNLNSIEDIAAFAEQVANDPSGVVIPESLVQLVESGVNLDSLVSITGDSFGGSTTTVSPASQP